MTHGGFCDWMCEPGGCNNEHRIDSDCSFFLLLFFELRAIIEKHTGVIIGASHTPVKFAY